MYCPTCGETQYYQCSDPNCECHVIPEGKKPQIVDGDIISCPYCGRAMHIDGWAEEEWKQYKAEEEKQNANG